MNVGEEKKFLVTVKAQECIEEFVDPCDFCDICLSNIASINCEGLVFKNIETVEVKEDETQAFSNYLEDLAKRSRELPPDIAKIINENFMDLL